MIFLFRKEIKKWNNLWWLVLASLVFSFGGASFYLLWNPRKDQVKVASVNNKVVTIKDYQQVYGEMKSSVDDLAMYWGIPADRLAQMMGMGDMKTSAINRCIQNVFVDEIADGFDIQIDHKSFQDKLAKSVSRSFIDQSGKLNAKAYQNYLSRLHMSVGEFEKNKEKEFRRAVVFRFLEQSGYTPAYITNEERKQKGMKKSFEVLSLPFSTFLEKAKTEEVSPEDLKKYFHDKQELYRVGKKMKVKYWTQTPEDYKKKVDVDDELIERFYEKNKTSLYRIPPKVKVSTIVFKMDQNASPDLLKQKQTAAEKVLAEINKAPEKFAEVAKKHAKDQATMTETTDFFSRGTMDPELERVAFLRLKEKGDVSELVKTARGLEIVKLEDRIAATEKPLASVKEEIVKTLINRKSVMALQSDMEAVMRMAKNDSGIFEKFSEDNKLKTSETDWLSREDAQGYELLGVLAQKLFEGKKAAPKHGYFVHRGEHVLYKVTGVEESYIPKFEKVNERVKNDWYAQQAEKLQKKAVAEYKKGLLAADTPLTIEEIGKKDGFSVIKTPLVAIDGTVDALKDAGNIIEEAFVLNDKYPLYESKHKSDYYLARLTDSKPADEEKKEDEGADSAKRRGKQRYFDGFVASLQRNGKIEIDQKMLSN